MRCVHSFHVVFFIQRALFALLACGVLTTFSGCNASKNTPNENASVQKQRAENQRTEGQSARRQRSNRRRRTPENADVAHKSRQRERDASPQERAIGQLIVQTQLRAFRDNDYEKAHRLETPNLISKHRTPQDLEKLIEKTYPAFARVNSVEWRGAHIMESDKTIQINLRFSTTQQEIVDAFYTLKPQKPQNQRYLIDAIAFRFTQEKPPI